MALIDFNKVTIGYEGRSVISDLTFQIKPNEYVCIVGENGSGKTTLMKCLLGLIPPLSGKITFGDGLSQNEIGYLPQKTVLQKDFPASVEEVVLSGCLNQKNTLFYSKEQKKTAQKNMELTGITQIRKNCFRELSGGQQQRALLARALCATTKLLILDEPVTGLDPVASTDMYNLVKNLNKEGITVIMVSHDITAAVNNATKILHLSKDDYFFGSTHQYLHSDVGKRFLITDCPCDDCQHQHIHNLA